MSRSRWLLLHRLTFNSRLALVALSLALFHPNCALAFDFTDTHVTEDNGVFRIKVSAVIDAPPDYIRYVLADTEHIYRLSPSIIESEVLPSSTADEQRVRTRLLCCFPMFCREVERVDTVRMLKSGDFEAEIIPTLSEFKSGKATWKITPMDNGSHVVYEAHLEPDFYIPPVVGTQVAIKNLRDEFTTTFIRIEKIASFNAKREKSTEYLLSDATSRTLKAPCPQNTSASLE